MHHHRTARPTLTPIEMDRGDVLFFKKVDGQTVEIELISTEAEVLFTTLKEVGKPEPRGMTYYRFAARVRVDGAEHVLEREVPTPRSFYEPWKIAGVRIWLDAVIEIFEFMTEDHGTCRPAPRGHARLAVQDATLRICPDQVHPWCPLRKGGLEISDCYRGEDCWLGPYDGADAHGGLDINHPPGTPIWTPIRFDAGHGFFESLAAGANNNRHRGQHRWPDGSTWVLQCHHMTGLTVSDDQAIPPGTQYASGAGVLSGTHDHSHFAFAIIEPGDSLENRIQLDPWILFWQIYQDRLGPPEAWWSPGTKRES